MTKKSKKYRNSMEREKKKITYCCVELREVTEERTMAKEGS